MKINDYVICFNDKKISKHTFFYRKKSKLSTISENIIYKVYDWKKITKKRKRSIDNNEYSYYIDVIKIKNDNKKFSWVNKNRFSFNEELSINQQRLEKLSDILKNELY